MREVPTTPAAKRKRRRRLLSDVDRRVIIQRLEGGERQADLAREFGVTRAAVCHINKHRGELRTRFDVFADTPHGRSLLQLQQQQQHAPALESVAVVGSTDVVRVLLTRLVDPSTDDDTARVASRRLYRFPMSKNSNSSFFSITADLKGLRW
ncbi:hypothetical protein ATCC90586_000330 [Pythium insidiosum]|nr:hypothetical protein ATCC90586_000330 [Pythium insidiosum]